MSKTKIILIVVSLITLGGFSFYLNKDSFASETIQVSHRVSPWLTSLRTKRANDLGVPVTFTLSGYYRLTNLKVVLASEIETNKYAHPIWELTSESNSVPVATFAYGSGIRGMHPAVKGARPDPLVPGVPYRLLVKTDRDTQAQHDFCIVTNR
ncbi:MAG TPA: hypothetical protein VFZ59_05835 [Verrucomicrobiae bacterium]|nr:hypothetical protein [Verrucomicrobiae bacterium]